MKILHIVHGFPPHNTAGTEIYTYNLSKELLRGHEVSVFYRISELTKKEYELDCDKSSGLNIFTVNNTFRFCDSFEKFYRNDAITKQFIRVLDQIKPDIVHIQHLIFLSTTIIDEVKKRGIPIVYTLHDYWLICPQWHFLKKDLSVCDNNDTSGCIDCLDYQLSIKKLPKNIYLALRNVIPDLLVYFLKNIYLNLVKASANPQEMLEKIEIRRAHIKELCSKVDLFIAPSQFLRKKFMEFGVPGDKIKLIPYGIKTESFREFRRKLSDKVRFGFIGTILPAKGLDTLIKAFNRIKDVRAELKIYGRLFPYNGFEFYPRHIKKLVKNRNIKFMGGFDHKDIFDVFSEIDVLLFPSIWNENCPLTILEAFSTGTPVIASRIGGVPELVSDGLNGLLFNPEDDDELSKKIEYIINKPDVIDNFRYNIGRVKNIEDNAKEMEEIYSGMMEKIAIQAI